MLIQLNIKNFALIEEVTMEFQQGFNILSGETGAGKSILIDAIDYILGGKFSKEIIRTGEEKTFVEAIFSIDNDKVLPVLDEFDIEYEDTLIISRETTLSGKSVIKVNGKSVIVNQLKKIREKILDIHGQHQNQNLLQKNVYITYLDNFIGEKIYEPLQKYTSLRQELFLIKEKIAQISSNGDTDRMIDYIKFQIDDIEKLNLKIDEEEELKEEYNILSNAEKINEALKISYSNLNGNDEGFSVLESLSKVINEISAIEKHYEAIKQKKKLVENAYYDLQEVTREIREIAEEIVFDEDRLSKINSRIYEINNCKKKYGNTVKDVLQNYEKLKMKYDELVNADKIITELKQKEEEILEDMNEVGQILHQIRLSYSVALKEKIISELSYVGLNKTSMNIIVELTDEHNDRGFDSVSFMISTNPGEPLKPLEKVLSGGELSRIMLALKCVFADKEDISTLIFDEIDTGVSGSVGQRVGEKMYQVSLGHQVLCITHLPQIAILSDYHYFVSKKVINGKTFTKIELLSIEEKINQVASMLGGNGITDATLESVREMLRFAENKKNEIRNAKDT